MPLHRRLHRRSRPLPGPWAWCWLLLGVAAALLAAPVRAGSPVDTFSASRDDPRLLFQAELAITPGDRPPGPDARWQPVTLPDSWRPAARWQQGDNGWYRFRLPGGVPAEPQALYLWRYSMNAAVWFNGEPVGDGGSFDEPIARNWNRPLLLRLPAALWRADGNELLLRLRVYPGFGHLMPPALGPVDELLPDHERRHFVQITLGQVAFGITGVALLAGLTLWAVDRRDSAPLFFVGACALWAVYGLNTFVRDLPLPAPVWWRLVHAAVDGFTFFVVAFHHRLYSVRRPRLEAAIGLAALACGVLYAAFSLPQLARWNPLLHGAMLLPALYLLGWLGLQLLRRPAPDRVLYFCSYALLLAGGVYDQLLNALLLPELWRDRSYVAHLLVPLMFLVFIGHLALRLAQGMRTVRALNHDLAQRVQAARAEVEQSWAHQKQLLAEQGAAQERERIYRDLHDSLGARLLSLVYSARDEHQAALARRALAEMRTIVAASRLAGGRLGDLATEWRLEAELRCEDAGWQLQWQQQGDALLGPRQRFEIERVLRELVSNALEHAHGHTLAVRWRVQPQELQLEVQDDGCGLSTDAAATDGRGLAGVRERVGDLRGHVQWLPAQPQGTVARVQVPLAAAADGSAP